MSKATDAIRKRMAERNLPGCFSQPIWSEVETLLDEIAALESSALRWRPIAEAPESRTILLFCVTDISEDGTVMNWRKASGYLRPDDWALQENETRWCWEGRPVMVWDAQPTHWMALPESPHLPRPLEAA